MKFGGLISDGPLRAFAKLGARLRSTSPKRAGIAALMVAGVLSPVLVWSGAQAADPPAQANDGTTPETAGSS